MENIYSMDDPAQSRFQEQLDAERRKVDVNNHDFSVRELIRMLEEGELNIAPEYQRKFRWTTEVASTFIESVFLELPIPPIFVATNKNFELEVVDGLQRLSTLIHFAATDHSSLASLVEKDDYLTIKGLHKLSELNDFTFQALPVQLQRYFARQPLQVVALSDKSDETVRFDLFERLNTGAVALSSQEIRACIYRGQFNSFLERMSENQDLKQLLKLQEVNQRDGTEVEQILKFFAYKNLRQSFNGQVKLFLNRATEAFIANFDYDAEQILFEQTMTFLASVVQGPFLRDSSAITPLVQFEACTVGIGEIIASGSTPIVPSSNWINDAVLVEASSGGSNTKTKLIARIDRVKQLFSEDG